MNEKSIVDNLKFTISSSPHAHGVLSTKRLMTDVIIALFPALIASFYLFGWKSLVVVLTSVFSCVFFEYISRKIMKRNSTISDMSAVVTGILLAFNLPISIPLWMVVFAALVAIVVVKQFFGGIGQNFVNPALMGRIVLLSSFPTQMATWTQNVNSFFPASSLDGVSSATPLSYFSHEGIAAINNSSMPSLLDMFLGKHAGSLGETCILALLIGFVWLIYRRVIKLTIPCVYIFTFAILVLIYGNFNFEYLAYQLMAGGLILGAVFMATDYSTSPLHRTGKIIYAIGCGILTFLIRTFASLPEGVSFAIILMNLIVPLIELYTSPVAFGVDRKFSFRKLASGGKKNEQR